MKVVGATSSEGFLRVVFRPHHTHSTHAAYHYRRGLWRGLCVCELCQSRRTDRDAVWSMDSGKPSEPYSASEVMTLWRYKL